MARLRVDVNILLAPDEVVQETTHKAEDDEVVMSALFGDSMTPHDPFCVTGKRTCFFDQTSDTDDMTSRSKSTTEGIPIFKALLVEFL